jgi:hypothetical protein
MAKRSIHQVECYDDVVQYCNEQMKQDLEEPQQKRARIKKEHDLLVKQEESTQKQISEHKQQLQELDKKIKHIKYTKYIDIFELKQVLWCIQELSLEEDPAHVFLLPIQQFPTLHDLLVGKNNDKINNIGAGQQLKACLDKHQIYLGTALVTYKYQSNPRRLSLADYENHDYELEITDEDGNDSTEELLDNVDCKYPRLFTSKDKVKCWQSKSYEKWFEQNCKSFKIVEEVTSKAAEIAVTGSVSITALVLGKKRIQ